jgi:hypothetical protein
MSEELPPHIARTLETWRNLRERSGNRLWTWRAYRRCRQAAVPIPTWVLRDFDDVSAALDAIACSEHERPRSSDVSSRILGAFGFAQRRGWNPFRSAAIDDEHLAMARAVRREIDGDDELVSQITAAQTLAFEKPHPASWSMRKIRTAWDRLSTFFS